MDIIDFRFRPNTLENLTSISNSKMYKELCKAIGFNNQKAETIEQIAAWLEESNVVKAIVNGRDCETTYSSVANGNDALLGFCAAAPGRLIGFWGIDPHKGMNAVRELTSVVNDNEGIQGVSIDPYFAKIYANDARYYPFYTKCCELNIPVIITTGTASFMPETVIDHTAPRYIDFVARDFPELKIVMSHGGYPWVNEAITVVQRNKNVYLEMSEYETWPQADIYVQAANSIISDKLLFASAHPFVNFHEQLERYSTLGFNKDVYQNVMYNNAAKVLGL